MRNKDLILGDVRIEFRNFAGVKGKYNTEGNRNFCVLLDDRMDLVEQLERDGWTIKWLKPRDEGDEPCPYIKIRVSFDRIPPVIYQITGRGKTRLDENDIGNLDWAEIENKEGERNRVDLVVSPYEWDVNGRSGIKGYVKTMYVRIAEDPFAAKYYNVPDSANTIADEDD